MMNDKDIKEYHKLIEKLEKKETYKPLPDSLHIGKSKIHGQGLVASEDIPMGTDLGISHYRKGDDVIRTPLGGFINHSEDPSATRKQIRIEPYWDKWNVTTIKDIKKGEEITLKYTMYRVDNAD
jgi:SET domain-containing protein